MWEKTRYKDINGHRILIGDIVQVMEYPDRYVGGSLDYEGKIEIEDGIVVAVYYDIGEREAFPLKMFPKNGRRILKERERYKYWKTAFLGGEPPEELWKREEQ